MKTRLVFTSLVLTSSILHYVGGTDKVRGDDLIFRSIINFPPIRICFSLELTGVEYQPLQEACE